MVVPTTDEAFLDQDGYVPNISGFQALKSRVPEDSKARRTRSLKDIILASSSQMMKPGITSSLSCKKGAEEIAHEVASDEDDDDFMTLQEMHYRVQKSLSKCKKLQCEEGLVGPSVPACSSIAGRNNAAPIMEVHLDSLNTDNKGDGNFTDEKGNAARSCDKFKDRLRNSGIWAQDGVNVAPPTKKREAELEEDVLTEEDEWTLQMWKTRLKHPRVKRTKVEPEKGLKTIGTINVNSETTSCEVGRGHHEIAEQAKVESIHDELPSNEPSGCTPDENVTNCNNCIREREGNTSISTDGLCLQQDTPLQLSSEEPEIVQWDMGCSLKQCSNGRETIECSLSVVTASNFSLQQLRPAEEVCPTDSIVLAIDKNREQVVSEQQGIGRSARVKNANMECQHGDQFNDQKNGTSLGICKSLGAVHCSDASAKSSSHEKPDVNEHKPATLLSKRKIISPVTREKLLWASQWSESGFNETEDQLKFQDAKRLSWPSKQSYNGQGRESIDSSMKGAYGTSFLRKLPREGELGSPCYDRSKFLSFKSFLSKVASQSPSPPDNVPFHQGLYRGQKLTHVLNASPSPPPHVTSSPSGSSPPVPANKAILRISPQVCQGLCKCEECVSVRTRAENAVEFSQHQMHDIESLAVKLMKELGTMRSIVEDKIMHRSHNQCPAVMPDQLKAAVDSAAEAEEMAKKWVVRMARDCNRYCKIMRMRQRRLSFADESGGQLCEVKVFHSQSNCVSTGESSEIPVVKNSCTTAKLTNAV